MPRFYKIDITFANEQRDDLFVILVNGKQLVTTLFVGERDINFVKPGQTVSLLFSQKHGSKVSGQVEAIFEADVDLTERPLGDIGLDTYQDATGRLKSVQTPYRVTVTADSIPTSAFVGSGGRARIEIPSQTMWESSLQFLKRIANTKL